MRDNVLGIKLGSNYSVGYGLGINPKYPKTIGPRVELTCVHKVPAHLLRKDVEWRFSRDADRYDGSIYPLEYGLPRGGSPKEVAKSCMLLGHYVKWMLEGVDDETGIVFCLPMMKYKEGMDQLKTVLNKKAKGSIGKRYIMEAWAAALATVGVKESLSSQVISMNFGSSTLEVCLYVGKKMIAQNVYPFGGWTIDREMQHAISQANRGITVTPRQARMVKEQYNYKTGKSVDGEFTKDGRVVEVQVTKEVMNPILEWFTKNVANNIASQFLPVAAQNSQKAVTAIQTEGMGYLCICGGMSNMPGFADLMGKQLIEARALNPKLEVKYPTDPDGVAAPAYGAYMLADMFEEQREEKKAKTW